MRTKRGTSITLDAAIIEGAEAGTYISLSVPNAAGDRVFLFAQPSRQSRQADDSKFFVHSLEFEVGDHVPTTQQKCSISECKIYGSRLTGEKGFPQEGRAMDIRLSNGFVDNQGSVWAIARGTAFAYRVDPSTCACHRFTLPGNVFRPNDVKYVETVIFYPKFNLGVFIGIEAGRR